MGKPRIDAKKAEQVCMITDDQSYYLFRDLCEVPGVHSYIIRRPSNPILHALQWIHTNKRLANYVHLPFQDIWLDYKAMKESIPANGTLLTNSSAMTLGSLAFWKLMKRERPDARFVLILVDSMHAHSRHMAETKKSLEEFPWDLVLSYDKADCAEYGFRYLSFHYYSHYEEIEESRIASDLYYISSIKPGRGGVLREIDKYSKKYNVRSLLKIVTTWRHVDYGTRIRSYQPYKSIVADVKATNCILEVLQDGQGSQSLRYLEALAFDKKLLSNNPNLSSLPSYDPRYMHYFRSVEDIDWDWVKRKEPVRYENKPDFSSAGILDFI